MSKHSPGFEALCNDAKTRIREMSVADAIRRRGSYLLVDVREDREWGAQRIHGAKHLGKGVLERDVEERFPDMGAPLVLYCRGGYRSILAADALQRMGYTDVYSLKGGFKAWRDAHPENIEVGPPTLT